MQHSEHLHNQTTVIAYPILDPANKSDMEDNVYSSNIGDSNFADDTIEMSGNFFSQLDSMIAAVKVESSALDSMKEKLREVDSLRNQISTFTKRLLDADQANLNLKTNLVKVQEAYTELKKSKSEVESSMVPLRQELNRTKEVYTKERMARLSAQQETALLKDQIMRLEKINENLDAECKTIPALIDSNEILKSELSALRKRYKEDKASLQKQIKLMETQARDVEAVKAEVRGLSMRLLDISSSNHTSNNSNPSSVTGQHGVGGSYSGIGSGGYSSNVNLNMMQLRQSRDQQHTSMYHSAVTAGTSNSHVEYEYGFDTASAEDDLDEYAEEDTGTASRGDDSLYDGNSFADEGGLLSGSVESLGSQQVRISPPRNNKNASQTQYQQQQQQQQQHQQQMLQSNVNSGPNSSGSGRAAGKKKVKRVANQGGSTRSAGAVNMMQQIPHDFNSNGGSGNYGGQQHGYRATQPSEGAMTQQSFSLPRIH